MPLTTRCTSKSPYGHLYKLSKRITKGRPMFKLSQKAQAHSAVFVCVDCGRRLRVMSDEPLRLVLADALGNPIPEEV